MWNKVYGKKELATRCQLFFRSEVIITQEERKIKTVSIGAIPLHLKNTARVGEGFLWKKAC